MHERPYQKLIAWQEAHRLCLNVYALTKNFPREEQFGLTSQMRRSSSSIPTNIAEGNEKRSRKEQKRFLEISLGSIDELHYQCLLASDLHYITKERLTDLMNLIHRVGYLIRRLQTSLHSFSAL
jgi:four helix bundle protein